MLGAAVAAIACGGGRMSDGGAPPVWVERRLDAREATPGGRPPLLVLLHGIGADEDDLFPLAARLDPRFTVVSLHAPHPYPPGFAWFRIDFRPGARVVPDGRQAAAALADLTRWLAAAPARLGTDPARTFVLGFSQGAMMSLGVVVTAPERVAGVVALSGRGPDGLFETTASSDAIARVPLLVAHGTRDDLLPVEEGRRVRDTFAPRARDFRYHEFDGGHGIEPDELTIVARWLASRL